MLVSKNGYPYIADHISLPGCNTGEIYNNGNCEKMNESKLPTSTTLPAEITT